MKDSIIADWNMYLDYYPDLRKNGINTVERAKNHWESSGKSEGRVLFTNEVVKMLREAKYPDPERIDFFDYICSYSDVQDFSKCELGYSVKLAKKHWLDLGRYQCRHIKFKNVDYSELESYILENHMPVNSIKKINVVTSMYYEKDEKRLEEYQLALKLNIMNPAIGSIVVFYEPKNGEKFEDIYPTSSKVSIINCNQRPSFGEIFDYTNKKPGLWVIANADIFLSNDFSVFQSFDFKNKLIALTRWDFISEKEISTFNYLGKPNEYSQDAWIYKSPISYPQPVSDIGLGQILCDSNICHLFSIDGYSILNPCNDIKILHIHLQNSRKQSYEGLNGAKEKMFKGSCPNDWPRSKVCSLSDII
jgi:hypothetical protein